MTTKQKVLAALENRQPFLESLESTPRKIKQILHFSNNSDLNLLLRIIRLTTVGEIHIAKSNFKFLKSSKKLPIIQREFENLSDFKQLIKKNRKQKLLLLYKLLKVIPFFIKTLFESDSDD